MLRINVKALFIGIVLIGAIATLSIIAFRHPQAHGVCKLRDDYSGIYSCLSYAVIKDLSLIRDVEQIALTPDGLSALVVAEAGRFLPPFLFAFDLLGGHKRWSVELPRWALNSVALSGRGDKAAVFDEGSSNIPMLLLSIPERKQIAEIAFDHDKGATAEVEPLGVTFTEDDSALAIGYRSHRVRYRLADGTVELISTTDTLGGTCGYPGRSRYGGVISWDLRTSVWEGGPVRIKLDRSTLGVVVRAARFPDGDGRIWDFDNGVCPPTEDNISFPKDPETYRFFAFSPQNEKLAVIVQNGKGEGFNLPNTKYRGDSRVEIWNVFGNSLSLMAFFSFEGYIGRRVGWSADGLRLATLSDGPNGPELRVFGSNYPPAEPGWSRER
jgi:hypothetical protein